MMSAGRYELVAHQLLGSNAEPGSIDNTAIGGKRDSYCDGDSDFIADTDACDFIHTEIDRANARGWQKTSCHVDAALAP